MRGETVRKRTLRQDSLKCSVEVKQQDEKGVCTVLDIGLK